MKQIPFLKAGDAVALVAPAKHIEARYIQNAITVLESWGLSVQLGKHVLSSCGAFAGGDHQRLADLQEALDNPAIKAVFCARGGYGCVRIIDQIDFSKFVKQPKWLIGYSDITVIQSHILENFQIPSIHGEMPLNYPVFPETNASLQSLKEVLFGEIKPVKIASHPMNREGLCFGEITGGNLAIICSLLGSTSEIKPDGKILFLEDVGEHLYQIDRMMMSLKRAGKLDNLAGLLVGQFTHLEDNQPGFGQKLEAIILDKVAAFRYPVMFNFPAGHCEDNRAFLFGKPYRIEVNADFAELSL